MSRIALLFALQVALAVEVAVGPVLGSPISDAAYPLLAGRVTESASAFAIYRDADSAFNHGYPSGFFGEISKVRVNAACVHSDTDPSGCCAAAECLDTTRGNVCRITFDALSLWEYAGVNWEEPENWAALGYPASNGYNLTGAEKLVFEARSPTPGGIQVRFGLGSSQTGWQTVTDWQTYEIPLSTLSPAPGLLDVHVLFSVVTNGYHCPSGGILILDNIRLEPPPAAPVGAGSRSLPLSTQTFGVVPAAADPFPLDQVIRNVASTYESALTILALLERGEPSDLAQARSAADALSYALHHDSSGRPLPTAPDGSRGLHNAYSAGELALMNAQPGGALAGESRLAGFTVPFESGAQYWLLMDGATGGNNAFAILALVRAYQILGEPRYLSDAVTVGRWIYSQLLDPDPSGYGGYFLGYRDSPADPGDRNTGKSTENNADIFAAFMALSQADAANRQEWARRANVAGDFVMAMFDVASGRFFTGTVPSGTQPGPGVDPTGAVRGGEVINVYDFLDASSFPVLAMAGAPRYHGQIDWRRPVQHIASRFAQTVSAGGATYRGFGLDGGHPGIAWEFTAQAVAAMKHVDRLRSETAFASSIADYLAEIRKAQTGAPFGDGKGLAAATVGNGQSLPPVDQCLETPHQRIPERVGLAATAWAIFADSGINVLAPKYPVVITNRDAAQPIISSARSGFLFRVNGRVSDASASGFLLDDGSGSPVRVLCGGHTLSSGDIAEACGTLDNNSSPPVLIAPAGLVVKH